MMKLPAFRLTKKKMIEDMVASVEASKVPLENGEVDYGTYALSSWTKAVSLYAENTYTFEGYTLKDGQAKTKDGRYTLSFKPPEVKSKYPQYISLKVDTHHTDLKGERATVCITLF